jgi:hypothetical protein
VVVVVAQQTRTPEVVVVFEVVRVVPRSCCDDGRSERVGELLVEPAVVVVVVGVEARAAAA